MGFGTNIGFSSSGGGGAAKIPPIENLPVQPLQFRTVLHHGTKTVLLKWKNPSDELFSNVIIVRKTDGEPKNVKDGKTVYSGSDESYTDDDEALEYDSHYYYRIFSVNASGQTQTMPEGCVRDVVLHDYSDGVYLSDLEVGAKIKFGRYKATDTTETATDLYWIVADRQYLDDGIVTVAQADNNPGSKIFDAGETGNTDGRQYGNNLWSLSNIRQWLNSQNAGGEWYTAQHELDQPPTGYKNNNGFLRCFTDAEIRCIIETENKLRQANCDGSGTETVIDDIWLASAYEVGLAGTDGTLTIEKYPDTEQVFELFKTVEGRVWNGISWWLRSLYASFGSYVGYVNADGGLASNFACFAYGLRAFCNLSSSILLSWSDEDEAYIFESGEIEK